jgi:hypothetical protein
MRCTGSVRESEGTGEHVQEQEPNVRAVEPSPGLEPTAKKRAVALRGASKGPVGGGASRRKTNVSYLDLLGTWHTLLVVSWAPQIHL